MTRTSTWNSKVIAESPERVYRAFVDRGDLLAWLPPGEMTGEFHTFDPQVGGGYEMSLYYPPDEETFRGKSAEREDRVKVRFAELDPPRRIVEAITFDSPDPAFAGEMTLTAWFDAVPGGTQVTLLFENLPPGLRPEDNEAGAEMSLEQLASYLE